MDLAFAKSVTLALAVALVALAVFGSTTSLRACVGFAGLAFFVVYWALNGEKKL
jgi:hypothetical protein